MPNLPEGPGLYQIVSESPWAHDKTLAMNQERAMQGVRLTDFRGDANVDRPVEYWIHVFNIGQQSFTVARPPCFPGIQIRACPLGQAYIEVMAVPNVVNEKWIDADSGEVRVRGIRGQRFAMDVINPANMAENMWQEIETSWIDAGTNDLSRRGVFWTLNQVPTDEELKKARVWMERHYRSLLQQADNLARQNRPQDISPEAHLAAEYFHVSSGWHTVAQTPSECPNCGETVKAGLAYHVNAAGILCVIDWQRAVNAGVKHRDDVPQEKRWWVKPSDSEEPVNLHLGGHLVNDEPDDLGAVSQTEEEYRKMTE